MSHDLINPVLIVYVGEALLLLLCGAFVYVVFYSHRNKLRLQEDKLKESKKSEENYKLLFHNSPAGMLKFMYGKFEVLDANDALLQLFSCDSLGSLDATLTEMIPDHLQRIIAAVEEFGALDEYELSFRDKNGSMRWFLISVKTGDAEKIAYGVFREITRRKIDQEKIEEQAALLNRTRDSVIVLTIDGEIIFWNNAASDTYGWKANEAVGKMMKDLLCPTECQYEASVEDVVHFGEWSGEQTHVTKAHKNILIESSWERIDNQFTKTATLLIVGRDITEKRALELSSLYNQKMEAIALMTSGIAHDLQNILAPMALSMNILRGKMNDPAGSAIISKIEASTANGLSLVRNILWAGRGISGMKTPLQLTPIIDAALRNSFDGHSEKFKVEKRFLKQRLIIQGDESQLHQVFLNLFQNAKDAMPGGGSLSVSIRVLDPCGDVHVPGFSSSGDSNALIEITDTGHGVSPELMDKIFEPFYTTKEGAGGTGLGLPIVKNIMRNHSGTISVISREGVGTTFSLLFPVYTSDESEWYG